MHSCINAASDVCFEKFRCLRRAAPTAENDTIHFSLRQATLTLIHLQYFTFYLGSKVYCLLL